MKLRVCWRSELVAILVPAGSIWFSFFVASFLLSGPFDLKTSVTLAKGGAWRVVSKGTPIKVGSRVLTKGCSSPDNTRRLSAVSLAPALGLQPDVEAVSTEHEVRAGSHCVYSEDANVRLWQFHNQRFSQTHRIVRDSAGKALREATSQENTEHIFIGNLSYNL